MNQLRDIVKRVAAGERHFEPASQSHDDILAFQPVANRLEAARARQLIQDVKFQKSSSRDKHGLYITAIVLGGVTFEGEQFLEATVPPQPTVIGQENSAQQPRIFISHSSKDEVLAEALISLLRQALPISPAEIRCTSVEGYKLDGGATVDSSIRDEIMNATVFVALLSSAGIKSTYVLFEIGARWGSGKHLIPILTSVGLESEVGAPLNALHMVQGASEADMLQFIQTIGGKIGRCAYDAPSYIASLQRFIQAVSTNHI